MTAVPLHTLRPGQAFRVPGTALAGKLVRLSPGSATVRYDDETRNVEVSLGTLVELGPFPQEAQP